MPKKKDNKSVIQYLKITNHMRCPWAAPPEIMRGFVLANLSKEQQKAVRLTAQPMCGPNEFIEVEKSAFDRYYKGSKAFQSLVDTKRLAVDQKSKKIVDVLLKEPEIPKIPKELTNDESSVLLAEKSDGLIPNLLSSKIAGNPRKMG